MANYKIRVKRSAQKELEAIGTKKERRRIVSAIAALAADPRPVGCKKLSASEYYRIRIGDYRVVYEIADSVLTILVIKVAHRRDSYRQ